MAAGKAAGKADEAIDAFLAGTPVRRICPYTGEKPAGAHPQQGEAQRTAGGRRS